MTTPKIEKFIKYYQNTAFESSSRTTRKYTSFQTKYINVLKDMAERLNSELTVLKGHFEFSAFFENKETGVVIYISIPDVRYTHKGWMDKVLVRTAKDTKDYRGGQNNWTTLREMTSYIAWLMKREDNKRIANQEKQEQEMKLAS